MSVSRAHLETQEIPVRGDGEEADLIDLLELRQITDEISQAELSRQIGVNEAVWSRARRRHERLGIETVAKVVARYPELRPAALRYLSDRFPQDTMALLAEAGRLVQGAA